MRGESRSTLSSWVVRHTRHLRSGQCALDLACGNGKHARYLADLGIRVTAIDIDISQAAALADYPDIDWQSGDLESEDWPYANDSFDSIIVTNYLHRPLLPRLAAALKPGGLLIYDTFGSGNELYGRPRNPEFLLLPAELLNVYQGVLKILAYEHGYCPTPRAAIRQRLCAKKE